MFILKSSGKHTLSTKEENLESGRLHQLMHVEKRHLKFVLDTNVFQYLGL